MGLVAQASVQINRSANDVFQFIGNMENFAMWFPEVISILQGDALPCHVVGKTYKETVKHPVRGMIEINLTVTRYENGTCFQTQGDFSPLMPQMTIRLDETPSGQTNLEWKMESRNKSLPFSLFMLPLIRLIMQKRAKMGVTNLKDLLERGHGS